MATQAQYDADPYIRREVITAELDWLGDQLCARTGRPRNAAGTKGDRHHMRGSHRSQDFILRSGLCTSRTYTAQSGLTAAQERHIAGFDFTPGSDTAMIAQCKRIYNAMRAGQLDEVREFYGNINGDQVVDGWNNIEDRNASSDDSHLWHWHLGLDRRHCNNHALMERILAIALDTPAPTTPEVPQMIRFQVTGQPAQYLSNGGVVPDGATAARLQAAGVPLVQVDNEAELNQLLGGDAGPVVQLDYDLLAAALLRNIATPTT